MVHVRTYQLSVAHCAITMKMETNSCSCECINKSFFSFFCFLLLLFLLALVFLQSMYFIDFIHCSDVNRLPVHFMDDFICLTFEKSLHRGRLCVFYACDYIHDPFASCNSHLCFTSQTWYTDCVHTTQFICQILAPLALH